MGEKTLYDRLGGYDSLSAVASDLLPRLQADPMLERFWKGRGEDHVLSDRQLLIDHLCSNAGGPLIHSGRDIKTSFKGFAITENDWATFLIHIDATLDKFDVPKLEREQVISAIESARPHIVEA